MLPSYSQIALWCQNKDSSDVQLLHKYLDCLLCVSCTLRYHQHIWKLPGWETLACKIWTLPQVCKKIFQAQACCNILLSCACGLCLVSVKPSRSLAFAKGGYGRRSGCVLDSPYQLPLPRWIWPFPVDCSSSMQALSLLPTLCLILALRFGSPACFLEF